MRTYQLMLPALVLGVSLTAASEQSRPIHSDVSHTLEGMTSATWADRYRAFRERPELSDIERRNPAEADALKVGLINLLITENADLQREKQMGLRFTNEEHTEYYGDLIGEVASLNDERSVPALLGAITTGGMAERGLARFGEKVMDPLLKRAQDPSPQVRSCVLFTLRYMLRMGSVKDPASRLRLRKIVLTSLDDSDPSVRASAISVIEYVDNREDFVPALEKLAKSDPDELPGTPDDGGDGGRFYPVRQDARKLLSRIAKHEQPHP